MKPSATTRLLSAVLGTAVLALVLAWPAAVAQTTFNVTVGPKTENHPEQGGWDESYRINGVDGAEVTVQRGEEYIFQMNNVPAKHPFYISTSATGGSAGIWDDGVTGNFATGNATLVFNVPATAPDQLYYQCATHIFMGWRINVEGDVGTDGDAAPLGFAVASPYPNPGTGLVSLLIDLPQPAEVRVTVTDLLGRRVIERSFGQLQAGRALPLEIDVAELAAGAYLFRVEAETPSETLISGGRLVRLE